MDHGPSLLLHHLARFFGRLQESLAMSSYTYRNTIAKVASFVGPSRSIGQRSDSMGLRSIKNKMDETNAKIGR